MYQTFEKYEQIFYANPTVHVIILYGIILFKNVVFDSRPPEKKKK